MTVLESKEGHPQASRVKTITLREGFRSPGEICMYKTSVIDLTPDTIVSDGRFKNLEVIKILPDYPTSFNSLVFVTPIFPFGLQLVRPNHALDRFNYGMPLESTTNPSSRQHLKTLRPRLLDLTFATPSVDLFTEMKDLVASTTEVLSIRFVAARGIPPASVFLCPPLQSFKRIELILNLPRPRRRIVGTGAESHLEDDPDTPGNRLVTQLVDAMEMEDDETQARYQIWKVDDWDVPGQAHNAPRTRLWPKANEIENEKAPPLADSDKINDSAVTVTEASASNTRSQRWERETNLRLLGGLINLRLESKKR
jgi:hypothetical protein